MDNNKTKQLTELKDYIDSLSDKYHAKYTNQVRGIMWNIKRKGNLTNEELGFILGIPETKVESMLHETWDGHVSTKLITKLQLLSCGVFGLPGCQMRKVEIDTIDNHFDKILCPVQEEPEEKEAFDTDYKKIADTYTPSVDVFERLLSIFDDDKEFQDNMRKKVQEYRERISQTAKNIGDGITRTKENVDEARKNAKRNIETAKKIVEIAKAARGFKDDIASKLSCKPAKDEENKKPEPQEPQAMNHSEQKTDEEYAATVKIDAKNGVSGKAYYLGEDGKMHPISLDEVFKKFGDFFSNLTD